MSSWWVKIRNSVENSVSESWKSTKEGLKNGAAREVLHATGYSSNTGELRDNAYNYDINGNIIGVNQAYANNVAALYSRSTDANGTPGVMSGLGSSTSLPINNNPNSNSFKKVTKWSNPGETGGPQATSIDTSNVLQNTNSDLFKLRLPDWGYDDFINERALWQKGLSSIFDEPAWFYFKVIFDFESTTGLFGGLLNEGSIRYNNNSALTYLRSCVQSYKQEKISNRITALYKFASILSYITTNAPWYFKDVKGLDKAAMPIISEFSQEKSIELGLNSDAIDMRLSTLMSLYQYACYDKFNGKEIIPQNLRLFNMTVIIFQTPLRYLHTSYVSNTKTTMPALRSSKLNEFAEKWHLDSLKVLNNTSIVLNNNGSVRQNYKRMTNLNGHSKDYSDMMSMKIFTFEGCEFDPMSFAAMIPASVTNESPFKIGETSLKITYSRCIEHTMNEFYGIMFGTDGFYFNNYSTYQSGGGSADKYNANNAKTWNKQLARYKSLSDTFEDIIGGGTSMGINSARSYKKAIDASEAVLNGMIKDSDILNKIGTNALMRLLGRSWTADANQGNIYGSNVGINSDYFKEKLKKLKNGIHERTEAPYKYDPKKDTNFNLQQWMKKTETKGFGGSASSNTR